MVPRTIFPMLLLPMLAASAMAADECTYRTGARTVALVELYTSEGCSSCPPADRWISGFVSHPQLERFVPLSFHVNYWDDLGWKDRFADQRYTERQRALAKATGAREVYTPQVTLQGRDARNWRDESSFAAEIDAVNKGPNRATIEVRPKAAVDGGVVATATATILPGAPNADSLALLVALTQDGLSNKVTAGENKGETLRHNFVVRDLAVTRGAQARSLSAMAIFRPKPDYDLSKMRVAAFVQDVKTGAVLQAISAPICK
jgi:hypothetical protein